MYRPNIFVQLLPALLILLTAGCATLPKDVDRPESYALNDTDNTAIGTSKGKSGTSGKVRISFVG